MYACCEVGSTIADSQIRILADVHISPLTIQFLNKLGYDAVRVNSLLPAEAADTDITEKAIEDNRVLLSHDLDFSEIIALSGDVRPSLISLRLEDPRVENVNRILERVLPNIETDLASGAIVTVEDRRVRVRRLPVQ